MSNLTSILIGDFQHHPFLYRAKVLWTSFFRSWKWSWNYFCLSGLLNYLSYKIIQIKTFFYNNLLREPSFPTYIGIYINSQTDLSFIHHNLISELHLFYYIFTLLESCSFKISKIYLTQKIFSEGFTETWKTRK